MFHQPLISKSLSLNASCSSLPSLVAQLKSHILDIRYLFASSELLRDCIQSNVAIHLFHTIHLDTSIASDNVTLPDDINLYAR
jgi:hypothetical protein